jgi:hypothetical protein
MTRIHHLRRERGCPWRSRRRHRLPAPPAGSTPRGGPARRRPSTRTLPAPLPASGKSSPPCCPGQRYSSYSYTPIGTARCCDSSLPACFAFLAPSSTPSSPNRPSKQISAMRGAKGKAKAKGGARWGCTSRRSKRGAGLREWSGRWPGLLRLSGDCASTGTGTSAAATGRRRHRHDVGCGRGERGFSVRPFAAAAARPAALAVGCVLWLAPWPRFIPASRQRLRGAGNGMGRGQPAKRPAVG